MRKYPPNESCCGAVYDNAPADNPFLAALPEMLPRDEFLSTIRSTPGLPHDLPRMSPEERRQSLPMLASLFVPLDYMYAVYDQLYRAIRETYTTRTAMEKSVKSTLYSAERRTFPMLRKLLPALSWECRELARPPPSGGLWKPCPRLLNTPNTWDSHFTANRSYTYGLSVHPTAQSKPWHSTCYPHWTEQSALIICIS